MRTMLVVLVLAAAAEGPARAQGTGEATYARGEDHIAARAAIDSVNASWCRAYEARDVAGMMAIYTGSPIALSAEGDVATGRETLEASAAAIMRYNPIRAHVTTAQVWLVDPNTAYEYGSYTITFVPEVTDTVVFTERYVAEWKRQRAGDWRLRLKMGLPSQ